MVLVSCESLELIVPARGRQSAPLDHMRLSYRASAKAPACGHCLPERLLELPQQLGFEPLGIDRHFAGGNLLLGGAVIAKLADAEALLRAHGRPKNAAGHGTGKIQITKAGDGIERRTGLVIGEVFKTGFRLFRGVQQARYRITREVLDEPLDRSPRPLANGTGSFRIGLA